MKTIHFVALLLLVPVAVPVMAHNEPQSVATLQQVNATFVQKKVKGELQKDTQSTGNAESSDKQQARESEKNLTPASIYNNNGYFSD